MAFTTQEDIGNRAAQHNGARRFTSFSQTNSRAAQEIGFCYDKLREAELRRSVWRFATRRAVLRVLTATTFRFAPGLWDVSAEYSPGQVVGDATGVYWICQYSNSGHIPGVPIVGAPAPWAQYFGPVHCDQWSNSTIYYAGDVVAISTTLFLCTANGSVNQAPGAAPWVQLPTPSILYPPTLLSPAGPGLTVHQRSRNIFPLPNGYLRLAGPDPKIESTSTLSTSGALQFKDWMFENDVLISNLPGPLFPFRFVADVSDVTIMDALFCEALGARIGYEVCETLTQSSTKMQTIGAAYQKFMRDARIVNQIETGATEMDEEAMQLSGPATGAATAPQAPAA